MTGSLSIPDMLPGLHRVKARGKSAVTEYWYAWRGGPQLLKVTARSDQELATLVAQQAPDAIKAFKEGQQPKGDNITLHGLVTRYLIALEDMKGAPRTKKDLRKHLDRVRTDIGKLEIRALESKRARAFLIAWRDKSKATPKSADERMGALSKVLDWAVDQGVITRNPADGVTGLYKDPDRSAIIWEPQHLEILLAHAAKEFADFVLVSAYTGIRLGDLRALPRSAVGADAIVFQTGKSNRRRTAVVPITDDLRAILAAIPRRDSTTLLNSSRGKPWSQDGLESAMQRAKRDALDAAQAKGGPTAESGIEERRIHDLRGTAATNFIRAGLGDEDIATILGWKSEQVGEIRRRYVSGQEIGLAIVRRMRENKARAEAVKGSVKTGSGAP